MTLYRVCRTNGSVAHIQSDSIPAILKHFAFQVRWIENAETDALVWGKKGF